MKKILCFVVAIAVASVFVYGIFAWKNQSWPFTHEEAAVEEVLPEAEIDISADGQ